MSNITLAYDDFKKNRSNKYLDFIFECREKYPAYSQEKQKSCYAHHIVPRHHYKNHELNMETFDLPANTVRLTFEDHIKAHEIRYEVYQEYGDLMAARHMSGLTEEGMTLMQKAGGQAVNVKFKKEGRLMYDPECQAEMAGRSMARPDAREIRSKGGKKGGTKRQENRIIRVEDRYEWCVDGQPFLCTFNFNSGGDLLKDLYTARPTKLQRVSPLINGTKKKLHGWSCKKIETSSTNDIFEDSTYYRTFIYLNLNSKFVS